MTQLPVGRRASGFVQVAKWRATRRGRMAIVRSPDRRCSIPK